MDKAWTKMNETATKSGRCEQGFFIYAENNGSIHAGDIWLKEVECEGTNATIELGIPVSNITVCTFFHCHTTLKQCPTTVSRTPGPSGSDEDYAIEYQIPGILMDYSATVIKGTKDDPFSEYTHKIYTFGPSQRPDLIIGQ